MSSLLVRRAVAGTCVLAMLLAGAALAACVVVPRLAGATPYAVQTGSMRPTLPPGHLVVVRPVAPRDVGLGDVVTYQLVSGEPEVVTHRVVAKGTARDGRVVLRTQGDANGSPDQGWVREEQLRGGVWYDAPHLGRLHAWLTGAQHEALVRLAAGMLVLHALAMFARAVRERRERRAAAAREVSDAVLV